MYLTFAGGFACVAALLITILFFIFIIPAKRRPKSSKFGQFIHDLCNFKVFIIEKILQFMYIFVTFATFFGGFVMLFWIEERIYPTEYVIVWKGYYGLLLLILGPIAVRIVYELLMLGITAVKNIIEINGKLKNQNEENKELPEMLEE